MEVSSITKKSIFVIIFIICIFIRTESYSKYSYLYIIDAVNLNFDRTKPIISVTKVENTNKINPEYANNKQTITLTIEVKEKNVGVDTIEDSEIVVKVDNKIVLPNVKINQIEKKDDVVKYEIKLSNILENGKLKIEFKEGTIIDNAKWKSDFYSYQTDITIDNDANIENLTESLDLKKL